MNDSICMKICRLCLENTGTKSIHTEQNDLTISEILKTFTKDDNDNDKIDNYPQFVCVDCFSNIRFAYDIIKLCQTSGNRFEKLCSSMKEETNKNESWAIVESSGLSESSTNIKSDEEISDNDSYLNSEKSNDSYSDDKLTCKTCNEKFRYECLLIRHMRKHTGEKPYKCKMCKNSYSRSCDLNRHIKVHLNIKNHKCKICNQTFIQSSDLRLHSRIHSGEKPFKCNTCNRKFTRKSELQLHLRIHTGEKPYKCKICDKSFARQQAHRQHLRVHTGEKPYHCKVCGHKSSDSSSFRRHKLICLDID